MLLRAWQVAQANFEDPASLRAAFEGADAVFGVTGARLLPAPCRGAASAPCPVLPHVPRSLLQLHPCSHIFQHTLLYLACLQWHLKGQPELPCLPPSCPHACMPDYWKGCGMDPSRDKQQGINLVDAGALW